MKSNTLMVKKYIAAEKKQNTFSESLYQLGFFKLLR